MPRDSETPVEMLKVRITYTDTGYPVTLKQAQEIYGKGVNLAPEPGWFWIGATPKAAASMREKGHRAIGSMTTTWFPPDDGRTEEEVPPLGSKEDIEIRFKEVRDAGK